MMGKTGVGGCNNGWSHSCKGCVLLALEEYNMISFQLQRHVWMAKVDVTISTNHDWTCLLGVIEICTV